LTTFDNRDRELLVSWASRLIRRLRPDVSDSIDSTWYSKKLRPASRSS
jgi:hypothetical protein